MSDIGAITYGGGNAVTLNDVTADPNGPFDALEATASSGLAKVQCANGTTLTVYLVLGVPKPIAVTRVWQTTTAAAGIIGYKGQAGTVA